MKRSKSLFVLACVAIALASLAGGIARADVVYQNIWDTQVVNADGVGINPYVGSTTTKIRIEGIALNDSDDYLDPNVQFQVYVQGVSPDMGGIAAWAGSFYQGGPGSPQWLAEYTRLTTGWKEGDLIRIEGWIANRGGKTNINERHSDDPYYDFTITLITPDVGLPDPIILPSVQECNIFDQTRATGGERYQSQWARLNGVTLVGGTWAPGQTVQVSDDGGANTFNVLLSQMGAFDTAPDQPFDVIGIFDQEDLTLPFTSNYRLWVKDQSFIYVVPEPGTAVLLAVSLACAALVRRRKNTEG